MITIPVRNLNTELQCFGRTFREPDTGNLHFNWSADSVELTFFGTELCASFRAACGYEIEGFPNDPNAPRRENWPWVGIFLDDGKTPVRRFRVSSEQEDWLLFRSEVPEKHRIRITKLTENYKTFLSLTAFHIEGTLQAAERTKKKRIEIVGDSITCGYGNLINDAARHFYDQDEDACAAYGPLAADKLEMECSLVSISGITGVKHSGWMLPFCMHELYPYTDKVGRERIGLPAEEWDFAANPNDFVVVNLGTNDCFAMLFSGDSGELARFQNDYMDFIRTIRRCNGPDTHIICALGTMNYYLYSDIEKAVDALRRETGDQKLHTLRFKPMHPMDGIGADGHPYAPTHVKMAAELAALIEDLL